MSCASIGCFVLSRGLCGCWKAALKARERLWLQESLVISPPRSGSASHQPWESHRLPGSCKGYTSDLRPAEMNTSRLPRVSRLKQFWRVSKKTRINLPGEKKFNFWKEKEKAKLLLEMCCEMRYLPKLTWGDSTVHIWCLAQGFECNFN